MDTIRRAQWIDIDRSRTHNRSHTTTRVGNSFHNLVAELEIKAGGYLHALWTADRRENAKTCKPDKTKKNTRTKLAIVREAHISIHPTDALFVSHHIIKIPAAERWCAAPSNERLRI